MRGAPARIVALSNGGRVLADTIAGRAGREEPPFTVAPRTALLAVTGLGTGGEAPADAGLDGWHAGSQLRYVGHSTALGPGCVVRTSGPALARHRERAGAGWVSGSELAVGLSTVTTRFADRVTSVVIVLDDPAAFGGLADGRRLLLGLDGAARAADATGAARPPVLLTTENRSVLAYDVVPDSAQPVTVTIASEAGWSLAGVMGAAGLTAAGALAIVSGRGLDAALRPIAPGAAGPSRLDWSGESRPRTRRRRR